MLIIVKGVKIPGGKEVKISAFADDTNFFCSTQQSIRRILILFELFGLASGSITNLEKSSVLFLGPWKPDADQLYGIQVTKMQKIIMVFFFII